jgi:two-component system sensor histidine kinase YesM
LPGIVAGLPAFRHRPLELELELEGALVRGWAMRMGRIKLRNQVKLMFSFMLLLIFVVLLVFFQSIGGVSRNINQKRLENTVDQLAASVRTHWATINRQANALAFNNYVSAFVESETPGRRYSNYMKILAFIGSIEATNFNIDKFMYINSDILCIANTYFTEYHLLAHVQRDFSLSAGASANGGADDGADYYRLQTETDGNVHYAAVRASYYDNFLQRPLMMVLFVNKSPFADMVQNLASERSVFLLADDKGTVVADSRGARGDAAGKPASLARQLDDAETSLANQRENLTYMAEIPEIGWKAVGISDIYARDSNEQMSVYWITLISACMAVLISMFVLIVNRSVISPIVGITSFVRDIGDDYATKRLRLRAGRDNEIGVMAHGINRMLDNICQLNENMAKAQQKLYMDEIAKRQIRLAALQSQINPHFLYNTLDCIRGISLRENIRSVADMASAVSKIFRYSIKAADYVCIADELNCIKDYMTIISIRHNSRIAISYNIDALLLDLFIPKMILQPIVENAVFHGLEPKKGQGRVRIWIFGDGEDIVFSVRDDGVGIDAGELARLRASLDADAVNSIAPTEKKSIGLLNIYQRLALAYGKNFFMRVSSEPALGTEVWIELRKFIGNPGAQNQALTEPAADSGESAPGQNGGR